MTRPVWIGIAVLLSGFAHADVAGPQQKTSDLRVKDPPLVRRIERLTWDAVNHVLWISVSRGTVDADGNYRYAIDSIEWWEEGKGKPVSRKNQSGGEKPAVNCGPASRLPE